METSIKQKRKRNPSCPGGEMLEIDGSMGEGGGSVLRLSLALAAVKTKPIKIYNIRVNRSNSGLGNQHLSGVKALKKLTNAEVEGAELRSEKVTFKPNKIRSGEIKVDIGTAGSTTLILQAVIIPAAFANNPVNFEIIGGTDNPYAPPIDYFKNVTIPVLEKIGHQTNVQLVKRGHYPKGGGKIKATVEPIDMLDSLKLTDRGEVTKIFGRSHCVKLPGHIAKRQAKSAEEKLNEKGYETNIEVEFYEKSQDPHLSPGTGIVLWAKTENGSVLGSNSLGEKGKPAEKVGREAAERLIQQLETGKAFDCYLTDQLIPYFALGSGKSEITTTELTSHTLTNLKLVEKIIGADTMVEGEEGEPGKITVEGIGFSRKNSS